MVKWTVLFVVLLSAVVGALYYFAYAPQRSALEKARREASLSAQEASSCRSRVSDLEGILTELRETEADLEDKIREREEDLAAVQSTQEALVAEFEQEIADGQIRVERLRNELRVDMVDEILFDSGEATLKQAGVEVLNRVGAVLKKARDKQIVVQGHTDNVPIIGRLVERFPTNWELSASRAVNVVRVLQEEVGLEPTQLSAAAFSEYKPRADNQTEEGRQKNRRIEILLAPMPEVPPAQPEEDDPKM